MWKLLLCGLLLCVGGCSEQKDFPLPEGVKVEKNSVGMSFVWLEPGTFQMGASAEDVLAEPDELPQHEVELTNGYWLGQFEVTQAEWEAVMGENPSFFSRGNRGQKAVEGVETARFPVESINWYEANRFCETLNQLPSEMEAGRSYRLPTEAEWEYACRAGTTTRFHYGAEPDSQRSNYLGDVGHPMPVGSYPPNPWGLFDMHGNVLEWCADWHTDTYYQHSPRVDPTGPEQPEKDARVLRGGGWGFTAASSAFRDTISPHLRGASHGLRIVMTQQPSTP